MFIYLSTSENKQIVTESKFQAFKKRISAELAQIITNLSKIPKQNNTKTID